MHPHAEPDNPELAKNSFIDPKGELEVQIVIKKLPLLHNEKIDLDVVFTSFKCEFDINIFLLTFF